MTYLLSSSDWWVVAPGVVGAVLTWFLSVRRVTVEVDDDQSEPIE
jgi:hypothetical protein